MRFGLPLALSPAAAFGPGVFFVAMSGGPVFDGQAGHDTLDGGAGNDTLIGGNGNDFVAGGAGNDNLSGGAGSDVFAWRFADQGTAGTGRALDTITDFGDGADRIALSAIDDLAFLAEEGAEFTAHAEIRWFRDGDETILEVDTNSDRTADLQIVLEGRLTLDETDFLL